MRRSRTRATTNPQKTALLPARSTTTTAFKCGAVTALPRCRVVALTLVETASWQRLRRARTCGDFLHHLRAFRHIQRRARPSARPVSVAVLSWPLWLTWPQLLPLPRHYMPPWPAGAHSGAPLLLLLLLPSPAVKKYGPIRSSELADALAVAGAGRRELYIHVAQSALRSHGCAAQRHPASPSAPAQKSRCTWSAGAS